MTAIVLALAIAAPVPKSAQFKLAGWGNPVDPLKDCRFEVAGGKLTVHVPGGGRELNIEKKDMNAPRVLRDHEGDFRLEAVVQGTGPKNAKTKIANRPAYFGAGLHVEVDDENYLRLEKTWMEFVASGCYVSFELYVNGKQTVNGTNAGTVVDPNKPTTIQLTRRGGEFTARFSDDGKEWRTLELKAPTFPAKLKLGVGVVNTSDQDCKMTFSQFKLDAPPAKP